MFKTLLSLFLLVPSKAKIVLLVWSPIGYKEILLRVRSIKLVLIMLGFKVPKLVKFLHKIFQRALTPRLRSIDMTLRLKRFMDTIFPILISKLELMN